MQQICHANAKTNVNIRQQIQDNRSTSSQKLSERFNISLQTVNKWKDRDFQNDASSRHEKIHYALSKTEQALLVAIRSTTWFFLNDV